MAGREGPVPALAPEVADVSNLGKGNDILAREDRRRLFSLGNQLWHSDSTFKSVPALASVLSARIIPEHGTRQDVPLAAM